MHNKERNDENEKKLQFNRCMGKKKQRIIFSKRRCLHGYQSRAKYGRGRFWRLIWHTFKF